MRGGLLCKYCTAGKCNQQLDGIEIECPGCEDRGCEQCGGSGKFELDQCPQEFIGDIVDGLRLVDLFYEGLPPVAGGVLNQSAWFISFAKRMKREENLVLEFIQKS